ncbi:MAG: DNA mismatch repair protein MutS, partial [Opitutae bacterium]|nr:DNA mismatch repair protein MutS [Opitutae bacterium]
MWLTEPSTDLAIIQQRQNAVTGFIKHPGASARVTELLSSTRDIPRILARLQNRLRNPRELGGIRDSLKAFPALKEELAALPNPAVQQYAKKIDCENDLLTKLEKALTDELPVDLTEGGALRTGFDSELDRLRSLAT